MTIRRFPRLLSAFWFAASLVILAFVGCQNDPNAAKMMEDHAERKRQVQKEQEFAKSLPPTQAAPQYGR